MKLKVSYEMQEKNITFPIKYDDIRVALVDVFPYSVHYYFDENLQTVFIVCVYHNSNNPEIPKSRNKINSL
jgi:hypothetical protein